eukprot:466683-Lingulodinium_polyedra.AAC.1
MRVEHTLLGAERLAFGARALERNCAFRQSRFPCADGPVPAVDGIFAQATTRGRLQLVETWQMG